MSSGKSNLRELALRVRMFLLKSGAGKSRQDANHDYFSTVIMPGF
jgi:hypothetical protein